MSDKSAARNSTETILTKDVLGYFDALRHYLATTQVTDVAGGLLDYGNAFTEVIAMAQRAHARGNKVIFIGNGGSAAIASHMALDYSNSGGIRALAMNDGAALTCLSNDYGYEHVFAKQIQMIAAAGDVLVCISSSGKSPSILRAAEEARRMGCEIVTLSGFGAENPLRRLGDVNFYLPADQYGYVEVGHEAICHAILDFSRNLVPPKLPAKA